MDHGRDVGKATYLCRAGRCSALQTYCSKEWVKRQIWPVLAKRSELCYTLAMDPKVTATVVLKRGREKPVLNRHPWIFSGAVQQVEGGPASGETMDVYDSHGQFLARGAYSPDSQIRVRIWSWDQDTTIDQDFFQQRIQDALQLRKSWINSSHTTAYRLIHAESDRLPGLIVDRYNDTLVMQILSAGVERWREEIIDVLAEILHPDCIYERSDVAVRQLEGLHERTGVVYGTLPEQPLIINENGLDFKVDILSGQKTLNLNTESEHQLINGCLQK